MKKEVLEPWLREAFAAASMRVAKKLPLCAYHEQEASRLRGETDGRWLKA